MEKETIFIKVDFDFDWNYGVGLQKLKADLEELEKLNVTVIEIEPEDNWGSTSVSIKAFTERIETDEEFQIRLDKSKEREESNKRRDLEQFNKIKAKYNL